MKIHRREFIASLGAFAASGGRASSQVMSHTKAIDLGHQGALYRTVLDTGEGSQCFCTAAVLPRQSFSARIVQQHRRAGALMAVQDDARKYGATVAINGGFFNGVFAPDGLLVVDGKILGRKRADWMGYLTIDADGNASVTSKPDLHAARYAIQGNPLLVEHGGKIGMERDDYKMAARSVIAQSGDLILAMVTSPVSLFQLAYALVERPQALFVDRIDAALNLSGAATASFYARTVSDGIVSVAASWPNREVILFSPRRIV